MEVEFAPAPPPLPPKSPTTKKQQQQVASSQQQQHQSPRPATQSHHPNYPKVSLQPLVQLESTSEGHSRVVPESPAVVAVPKPPQRSISLLEADYQNSSVIVAASNAAAATVTAGDSSGCVQLLPRPHSACNLPSSLQQQQQQQQPIESVISRSESTPNGFVALQKNSTTDRPVHPVETPTPPPNVYINISGGGSVQVDTTRSMASGVAIHASGHQFAPGAANAIHGGGGLLSSNDTPSTVRHVHEVHHHHHFHHGPRLINAPVGAAAAAVGLSSASRPSFSNNPFLSGSSSTNNPFLSGFALSGYGLPGNDTSAAAFSSSFSQKVPDQLAAAFRPSVSDLRSILRRNRDELAASGWYHGRISMNEANRLLHGTSAGTFLVRDSSAPDCMYALTFQQDTKRFPDRSANSVRIRFFESTGKFQLDPSNNCRRSQLPEFSSVVELIEFYVKSVCPSTNVLLDEITGVHYPIFLKRPLETTRAPASLQHLARLTVHKSIGRWQKIGYRQRNLQSLDRLGLPNDIVDDLSNYPYTI